MIQTDSFLFYPFLNLLLFLTFLLTLAIDSSTITILPLHFYSSKKSIFHPDCMNDYLYMVCTDYLLYGFYIVLIGNMEKNKKLKKKKFTMSTHVAVHDNLKDPEQTRLLIPIICLFVWKILKLHLWRPGTKRVRI